MNESMKQAIICGETSLGIEFGSTRIKAVLIDQHSQTLASSSYDWENQLTGGYWTYDLQEVLLGMQDVYRLLRQEVEEKYGVPLQKLGAIGCSGMMQGYIALDHAGELLVPFRTWRNTTTEAAAADLTERFGFKIPQRWSIAHLYQAMLNEEAHVAQIDYITTLSGYVHWLLTGRKVLGVGDASGMFPIDPATLTYNEEMVRQFDELLTSRDCTRRLREILPQVLAAGESAGVLTEAGARLLDPSGSLEPGVRLCPPEGDAGTGMVSTNSVKPRTGNISVGTSIFAMLVLEDHLSKVYPEIDIVTTPEGSPVAMVLANNCSSDINAWVGLFREFAEAIGAEAEMNQLFGVLFNKVLEADADGGGLLSYGYYSGENITGFAQGRPLFVRSLESRFTLANFMRVHLYTAFAALRLGMDRLTKEEGVRFDRILAHGGLFKTPLVGQAMCAAALDVPVAVMPTAGEGGAWGMAVLAAYHVNREQEESLADYLAARVFKDEEGQEVQPAAEDVKGFALFLERYTAGLAIEQAAVDHLVLNRKR
ncbi:ATPase [Paenibacillus sp. 598K]|uniref:xylulokinase n=1 Tax=Paenibacillus sp. 598K TaxID=1117987 RepID=UPI000FF95EDC|nr:FGGY-family carbohydrate kinase [Paenibacillus sp. 598K]GBF76559.1 ATPase [Paenibacillus sp. 598K]